MTVTPDLTQDEIDGICFPLKQKAAQVRYLRGLGLKVDRRPDGSALVNRKHYDEVRGGAAKALQREEEPNYTDLQSGTTHPAQGATEALRRRA